MLSTKDISTLLLFTPQGVNKWKKEKRPIISLLQKYFTSDNLQEFLKTEKITKMERLNVTNELEDELVDLFYASFNLHIDFWYFVGWFMGEAGSDLTTTNIKEKLYTFIYENISELKEDIQGHDYYLDFPEDLKDVTETNILFSFITSFNNFSDRELKFIFNNLKDYNPFRDRINPS